jgi:hypothetical protein
MIRHKSDSKRQLLPVYEPDVIITKIYCIYSNSTQEIVFSYKKNFRFNKG